MLKFQKFLSHLNIVFAGLFLILFVADRFNSAMVFIDNDITKWLLFFFCIASLILAIWNLRLIRRHERRVERGD